MRSGLCEKSEDAFSQWCQKLVFSSLSITKQHKTEGRRRRYNAQLQRAREGTSGGHLFAPMGHGTEGDSNGGGGMVLVRSSVRGA